MVGAQRKQGYASHPAARMWLGYESALAVYMTFVIREWKLRGYVNNIPIPYTDEWQVNPQAEEYAGRLLPVSEAEVPPWLGEEVFHAGHRGRLMYKDPEWYGQFGWREDASILYSWPHDLGYEYK